MSTHAKELNEMVDQFLGKQSSMSATLVSHTLSSVEDIRRSRVEALHECVQRVMPCVASHRLACCGRCRLHELLESPCRSVGCFHCAFPVLVVNLRFAASW